MNKLQILSQEGQLVVSSREVSDNFSKRHDNVLSKIEAIISNWKLSNALKDKVVKYFIESNYIDEKGELRKEFLLTRDGFSFMVMGFIGRDADIWKTKYIEAFNDMEHSLKNVQPKLSKELQAIFMIDERTVKIDNRITELEDNMPLFNVECKELQALVRKIGIKALGGYKSPAYNNNSVRTKIYKDIQHQLKREFGIERYEAIKRVQLDTAKVIVVGYKVPMVLVSEIETINDQIKF